MRVSDGVCGLPALLCRAEEARSQGALAHLTRCWICRPPSAEQGVEAPGLPILPASPRDRSRGQNAEKLQGEGLGTAPAFRVVRESKASILVLEKVTVRVRVRFPKPFS